MIYIFFKLKESIHRSSKEFRVSKSISNILIFFFRSNRNIILVSLIVVIILSNWTIQSFILPFENMFELRFTHPWSISDKSVLVLECPNLLFVNVTTIKSNIRKFLLYGTIWIEIGINSRNTFFVRTVQFVNGIPYFSLHFQIIFKLIDDFVVLLYISTVMILIKL